MTSEDIKHQLIIIITNAEARFNKSLRPRKPEGSLGRTAQDVHLDSHTAPELWKKEKDREEKVIGSWPGTCIQYTQLHV